MQPLYHHYPMLDAFSLSVVSCIANSVPKFKQLGLYNSCSCNKIQQHNYDYSMYCNHMLIVPCFGIRLVHWQHTIVVAIYYC